jgi:hypothetical protein
VAIDKRAKANALAIDNLARINARAIDKRRRINGRAIKTPTGKIASNIRKTCSKTARTMLMM